MLQVMHNTQHTVRRSVRACRRIAHGAAAAYVLRSSIACGETINGSRMIVCAYYDRSCVSLNWLILTGQTD